MRSVVNRLTVDECVSKRVNVHMVQKRRRRGLAQACEMIARWLVTRQGAESALR